MADVKHTPLKSEGCIDNFQNLEASKPLFLSQMDKAWYIHPYRGISSSNKEKCAIKPQKGMGETIVQMAKWKNLV